MKLPLYAAAALLLIAAGFAAALARGPLAVGWLAPLITASIEGVNPGAEVHFASPIVDWNKEAGSLDLSISKVVIVGDEGAVRLVLPRVGLGLSLRSLLAMSPAAKRIDLYQPELEITWSASELKSRLQVLPRPTHLPPLRALPPRGSLADRVKAPPAAMPPGEPRKLAQLPESIQMARRLFDAPDDEGGGLGYLESVRVHAANIRIVESDSGVTWRVPDAELEFRRDREAPRLIADINLLAGEQQSRLLIETVGSGDGRHVMNLRLENLDLGTMARDVGLGEVFKYAALPLSGEMRIEHVAGSGVERVSFELGAEPGEIDIPFLYPEPRWLDDLAIEGDFDLTAGLLRLSSIYLAFGGAELTADGMADFAGTDLERPALKLFATARNLDARTLVEYWPKRLGRSGHAWVDANVPVGNIPEARFTLDIKPEMWLMRPLPEAAVRIDFTLENATAFYLLGMPPIQKGRGTGTFTTERLEIRLDSGMVDGIPLHDSRHVVDKVGYRGQQLAHTTVKIDAPIPDIFRLIDYPPLQYVTKYEIPAEEIFGQAYVVTELTFKPKKGLTIEDVKVLVEAAASDVSYPTLLDGGGLTDGILRLTLDRQGLVSSGNIRLNGADFHLNWTQDFTPDSEQALNAHYELTGDLSGKDMERFGVPAVPDVLDRAHTYIVLEGRGGQMVRGRGHVDLTATGINSRKLSWSKPEGTPGRVEFDMGWTENTMSVDNIVARSPGISARANFLFDRETNSVLAARVPELKTSGHDLALTSHFRDGVHVIRVEARRFDARDWLDDILSGQDQLEPPMDIGVAADRVMTLNGIAMSDLRLNAVNDGNYWSSASLSAVMDDGGSFDLDLLEDDEGRHLTMVSDEAGRMAMGFGLFRNGDGGQLTMDAELNMKDEPSSVSGLINIEDFNIVKSSALAKAIVARTGQDVDKYLDDSGLRFRRLRFPFTFAEGITDISEARANGPQIGFTMRGQVNRSSGELKLDGVIVPAYAFNSLLGNIPLVGGLLTGGRGGGLFALTYRIEGSMSEPDISVNPLSALAPGFLRKIFEGVKGKIDADPDAAAPDPAEPPAGEALPEKEPPAASGEASGAN